MKMSDRIELKNKMLVKKFWGSILNHCDLDELKTISESFLNEYGIRESDLKEEERIKIEEEEKIKQSVNVVKDTLKGSGLTIKDVYISDMDDDDIYLYPTEIGLVKWDPKDKKRMPKELKNLINGDNRELEKYKTKLSSLV